MEMDVCGDGGVGDGSVWGWRCVGMEVWDGDV